MSLIIYDDIHAISITLQGKKNKFQQMEYLDGIIFYALSPDYNACSHTFHIVYYVYV